MTYRNVVAAVVRALASDVLSSAGGCSVEPRIQCAPVPGVLSSRDVRLLDDGWVRGRMKSHLTAEQRQALVAKYAADFAVKVMAAERMAVRVVSPAPARFVACACVTWAAPKLPGESGKRSNSVLPDGWYCMDRWSEEPVPVKTQERWRRQIRRDLEREVDAALVALQEVLEADGLLAAESACIA